jgi:multidrug efflux pump subunit AcrA (membrane-fusion protein)
VINDESYWVYVMKNGNILKRSVKIGRAGENSIEITKGLKAGDTIIKNPIVVARRTGKEVE